LETDPRIRKQAVSDIFSSVTRKEDGSMPKITKLAETTKIFRNYDDTYQYNDLYMVKTSDLHEKIYDIDVAKENKSLITSPDQIPEEFLKYFNKICKQHNISSFDQKIDFFSENKTSFVSTFYGGGDNLTTQNLNPLATKGTKMGRRGSLEHEAMLGRRGSLDHEAMKRMSMNANENREVLITTPNSIIFNTTKKVFYSLFFTYLLNYLLTKL